MRRLYDLATYVYIAIIITVLCSGCGIFNPPHKDQAGYFTSHYSSCGPIALRCAIETYMIKHGLPIPEITAIDISRKIQDNSTLLDGRYCLSLANREFVNITWPHEIVEICREYGFEAVKLNSIDDVADYDTGIVLLHKEFSLDYHWMCYSTSDRAYTKAFYGKGRTIICSVYLLKKID